MTSKRKNPAPKSTKAAAKKGGATKESAAKDAATAATPRAAKPPRERDPRLPAVGATIAKEWHGKTLKVLCTKSGFEYAGKPYTSLSAVAKEASGFASVNGYLFFDLIPKAVKPVATLAPKAKGRKPAEPKIGGEGNAIGTAAGQRAALAAAGVAKKAPAKDATAKETK